MPTYRLTGPGQPVELVDADACRDEGAHRVLRGPVLVMGQPREVVPRKGLSLGHGRAGEDLARLERQPVAQAQCDMSLTWIEANEAPEPATDGSGRFEVGARYYGSDSHAIRSPSASSCATSP